MHIELFYFMRCLRYIISLFKIMILLLANINAITPELINGVDENICAFMRVRCSVYYISPGVDAPQCICEALQKCFFSPRTSTDLSTARPTNVEDENGRFNQRLKMAY